ncbi:hypothetical protein C5L33_001776 [Lactobacillus pasteurii]|uniref:Uncharacterized protein n=1 Tax=Lactobacillus pasteurii DSM 23907 = CRBIP 24.76 TaxID=1423790 RepID=I7KKD3_9LACO|nr:hypothetical protein C5L33_001776 [Lactobacillus pasteurii]CCI84369.1 Protein of unknown function [Lactobacillus pasteurii DSM 23907 = CRBIP 24.76]
MTPSGLVKSNKLRFSLIFLLLTIVAEEMHQMFDREIHLG